MRIDVLTLFPEMFQSVLNASIVQRAANPELYKNKNDDRTDEAPPLVASASDTSAIPLESSGAPVSYHLTNIRDHTDDKKHGKVDKPPFGGGPGMVIQCQPVWDAVQAVEAQDPRKTIRILMTPQGQRLDQKLVDHLAKQPRILIIAGHYEGIDERVIQKLDPMLEISIGDYVLSGGELPAMVLIDAIVRLIPGVLGDETSTHNESFSAGSQGLLDYPHYTRPRVWNDMEVPEILLSGNHAEIEKWRVEQSRQRTAKRRPDLL